MTLINNPLMHIWVIFFVATVLTRHDTTKMRDTQRKNGSEKKVFSIVMDANEKWAFQPDLFFTEIQSEANLFSKYNIKLLPDPAPA